MRALLATLTLAAGFFFAPCTNGAATTPNIILILADDLGWADLGCYGNPYNETPNLDRLASEGIRFTQFYAGPVCSPTRANLQSGQDQARFGITQHIPGHRRPYARLLDPVVPLHLPLETQTFAESLLKTGYRTGYFGKWHLGGTGHSPSDQGWQTVLETKGNSQPSTTPGTEPRRTAELLTGQGIAFIESNQAHPFLLQVSHHAVHIPLSTTPELLKKYQAKPPAPGYPSRPEYAGLLEELDQSVGAITAAVDRLGLAQNTLILFTSDNGGLVHEQNGTVVTSNHPLRGEKGTLYEGGTRVPAIARWTGTVPPGQTYAAPAITYDLYPTLLELTETAPPPDQPLDGISLASLLRDPSSPLARDALHWHLPHYHHSTPASAIRQGDWKLLEFFEDNHVELYHLASDIGETTNLASQESQRTASMRAALTAWREKVGARLPVPNPDHDPARATELGNKSGSKSKTKPKTKKKTKTKE
jgi:uncharacterized sulfatase